MIFGDKLQGFIDSPQSGQVVAGQIQVRGWVLTGKTDPIELRFTVGGKDVAARVRRFGRRDVADRYPKLAAANPKPGFEADLDVGELEPGLHWLVCSVRRGRKRRRLAKVQVQLSALGADAPAQNQQRVLHMHIPKTAGTSLNAFLQTQFPPEASVMHVESRILGFSPGEVDGLGEHLLYSAHLKWPTLMDFFDLSQFFTVTVLRDPLRQTLSHLAWVKRLGAPDQKKEYNAAPDYVRKIAHRINTLPFPEFVDTMDRHEINFFDNCQTRYLLPFHGEVQLDNQHLQQALANLDQIDLVGLTERFADFLELFATRMGWQPPPAEVRLNRSDPGHILDIHADDQAAQERMERLTRFDQKVYAHAQERFQAQLVDKS